MEAATLAVIALIVGLTFRSVVAPLITLVTAGVGYLLADRVIGWLAGAAGLTVVAGVAVLVGLVVAVVLVPAMLGVLGWWTFWPYGLAAGSLSEPEVERTAVSEPIDTGGPAGSGSHPPPAPR